MGLAERKAAAQARIAAAEAALSDTDRVEIDERDEVAELEKAAREKEEARVELDLDRRMDRAREALGDKCPIESVRATSFPDTFIVMRNGAAHARWLQATKNKHKGADQIVTDRRFAMECVHDWNGKTFDENSAELTHALTRFLTENPGVVIPLTDAAARLVGVFAEARKS